MLALGASWLAFHRQLPAATLLAGELPGIALGGGVPAGPLSAVGTVRLDLGDAELTLLPGCQVVLRPGDGHRLRLEHGDLRCTVRKQPTGSTWSLIAPQGEVRVVGTRFTVKAVDQRLAVVVDEGVVELVGDGATRRIAAGEEAELAPPAIHGPVLSWRFLGADAHLRNRVAGAPPLNLGSDETPLRLSDGVQVSLDDAVWSMPGGDDGSRLAARFRASGEITMAAWIRLAGAPTTRISLMEIIGMTDASNHAFTILQLPMDDGDRRAAPAWRHRTVTLDVSGHRSTYGDGKLMRADVEDWNTRGWVGQLHLKLANPRGHITVPADPSYRLSVATVTLWDRVLSAAEIAALAASGP